MGNISEEEPDSGDPVALARECFRALQEHTGVVLRRYKYATQGTENPETIVALLWSSLVRANGDASILDPTGQKTATEMEEEVRKATENFNIASAREYFKALQEGTSAWLRGEVKGKAITDDPESIIAAIRVSLARAHADASALDPTGSKTAAEMEKEIGTGVARQDNLTQSDRQKYIQEARFWLDSLRDGVGNTDEALTAIRRDLKRAGVDASELDPEHKSSAAQMEASIREAYKQGNLHIAQESYNFIQLGEKEDHSKLTPWDADARDTLKHCAIDEMNAALKKAGVGNEALQDANMDGIGRAPDAVTGKPSQSKSLAGRK